MTELTSFMQTAPIWIQMSASAAPRQPLAGHHRADLVVVGAGIAGLGAAYYAAQLAPERRIVLVEAAHVGGGTTGRSTGIVTPGMKIALPRARRRYGDAATRAAFAASCDGVTRIRELIAAEGIDCDAREEPHLRVGLAARHTRTLRRRVQALRSLGFDAELLDRSQLGSGLADSCLAAQRFDSALLIDPFRFALGLADAACRLGVEIYEHSRVTAVDTGARRVTVRTEAGTVEAETVLLATNAGDDAVHPHPRSVFGVRGQAMATVPLTTEQLADLGWDGRGAIIDERHFFSHFRLTRDRRLLFGGGPLTVPGGRARRDCTDLARGFQRLHREMQRTFPALAHIPIAARWSAEEAASLDRLPVVGPVPGRGGVHYAGSWNGHGLGTAAAAAWRFARALYGRPDPPVLWQRESAPRLPGAGRKHTVLRPYLAVLDRLDNAHPLGGREPSGGFRA